MCNNYSMKRWERNGWPGLLYRLLKAVMWPDLPEIFRVSLNLGAYQHTAWGQLCFSPEKGHLGLVCNWKPMTLLCLCYKWVWNRLQLCVDSWEDEERQNSRRPWPLPNSQFNYSLWCKWLKPQTPPHQTAASSAKENIIIIWQSLESIFLETPD